MTILKVKSISYSLLAIFTLNVLLTSCEKDKPQTDETQAEIVYHSNSSGLAVNNNEDKLKEFQNISYLKSKVHIFGIHYETIDKNQIVELNGDLEINNVGVVTGNLKVINNDKSINGFISFENGFFYYKRDLQIVKLDLNNIENLILPGNGNKRENNANSFNAIDNFINNKSSKSKNLSLETQALCSFLAIINSPEWIENSNFASENNALELRGCSQWQKTAIFAVSMTIYIRFSQNCSNFSAACGVTVFLTFGATLVPCWLATDACYSAAWGGSMAVYETLINYFC